jgi:hypothetical protein
MLGKSYKVTVFVHVPNNFIDLIVNVSQDIYFTNFKRRIFLMKIKTKTDRRSYYIDFKVKTQYYVFNDSNVKIFRLIKPIVD